MIYLDTSAIVKLYIREDYSRSVSNWLRERDEAIPFTPFHELELTNAIRLKQFRGDMTDEEAEIVLARLSVHERKRVLYRPQIHWADIFTLAIHLSRKHTAKIGSRSLDIIHVASALSMRADGFLTFDERQSALAVAAGLKIEGCAGTA